MTTVQTTETPNVDLGFMTAFSRTLEELRTSQGLSPAEAESAKDALLKLATEYRQIEADALRDGRLRYGRPGEWFRSITWSIPAWQALHGTEGPRGRSK